MYPVLLNIKGKSILVVGGGPIALRKVKSLLKEEAKIEVWALDFISEFDDLPIQKIIRKYEKTSGEFDLIFACTNDENLNARIRQEEKTFVNNVSNKNESDFYNMGSLTWQDIQINISSQGSSPSRVKRIRQFIEEKLEEFQDEN